MSTWQKFQVHTERCLKVSIVYQERSEESFCCFRTFINSMLCHVMLIIKKQPREHNIFNLVKRKRVIENKKWSLKIFDSNVKCNAEVGFWFVPGLFVSNWEWSGVYLVFGWLLVRMREFPNSNMKCEFNALLPRGGREVSVTYSAPVKGE